MAKQKLNKTPPLSWVKSHKLVSVLVVLFVLVLGIGVYLRVALEINKHNFAQARKNIDTIYADIVAKVGQPDNSKRTNTCSQHNTEFRVEPRVCDVSTDFIYGVANENDANSMLKKIQGVIATHADLFKPTKPLAASIQDILAVSSYYHVAADSYKSASLGCDVNYIFDTPTETTLDINNKANKPFEISMGCNGQANRPYYPLAN
jgi:hypothetical protein